MLIPPFTQLKDEVIGFRAVDLMRTTDDGAAALEVGLVLRHPVSPRALETFHVQGPGSVEHADLVHLLLKGAAELPLVVVRVVVMRGDEDLVVTSRGSSEELLQMGDGVVVFYVVTDQFPGDSVGAQEIDLRVGDHQGGVCGIEIHRVSVFSSAYGAEG
ncbi:hypothetical protein BG28_00085 [Nesterenkonia sp. AN1]|nr:hypothetical protein BG28_00085 [Nesterenkonia sp. AN1]